MDEDEAIAANESPASKKTESRFALERLVFFSDAVFAIAITILVLDIRLPTEVSSAGSEALLTALADLWPKYLAFVISFWVIGLTWISHHRKFLYIERVDFPLMILDLLLLMMIAFIPFPTAVMSENATFTATAFYAGTMIASSLSSLLLWWHATRNRHLVDRAVDSRLVWQESAIPLSTAIIFLLSIGVAAVDPGLARVFWALVFPIVFFVRRRAG